MNIQVLTHNSTRVKTRRFFVNRSMADLFGKLELEICRVIRYDLQYRDPTLSSFHQYVRTRIHSLDMSEFDEFIDVKILELHLLDYCDVEYYVAFSGDKTRLTFRMFKHSEPLYLHATRR